MATDSKSSGMYGLGKYPLQHYVPLWIIVVFLFAVVVLCTMAGLQEGLGKRHFGDSRVKGNLEVTGRITGVQFFGQPTSATTAQQGIDLSATPTANNVFTIIQPANTRLVEVEFTCSANVQTAANSIGATVAVSIGTEGVAAAAPGTTRVNIVSARPILRTGSAARVTLSPGTVAVIPVELPATATSFNPNTFTAPVAAVAGGGGGNEATVAIGSAQVSGSGILVQQRDLTIRAAATTTVQRTLHISLHSTVGAAGQFANVNGDTVTFVPKFEQL